MEALERQLKIWLLSCTLWETIKKNFKANKVRVVFFKCETMCVFVTVVSL